MGRAQRIGYECYVHDGALVFRPPQTESDADVTLAWGEALHSFRPRLTLSEQVEEVIVRGWDVQKKQPIVGEATEGTLAPALRGSGSGGATQGRGSRYVVVDEAVVSQAEADILAAARANELSGVLVEAEGTAFRRPDIRAGRPVRLEALGKRFSGVYRVTHATHVFSEAGFRTTFHVCGLRTGLLIEQLAPPAATRWGGVVSAIVTNADDPEQWGRVKLKYPWLAEQEESDWARVAGAGAGNKAGFCNLPAVNDEVVVAFQQGDFGRPLVLGALWNGQDALPPEVKAAASGEQPLVRTWRSRTGHRLTLHDDRRNAIEIETAGGHRLLLDDANGEVTLTGKGPIKIEAEGEMSLKAGGGLSIEAGANLDLTASGQINVKGATINLN